jgi:hypothetical protein
LDRDAPLVEDQNFVAKRADLVVGVRGDDERPARGAKRAQTIQAFLLEAGVADRQHFVDDQDLGVEVHGGGEGEAQEHTRRIRAHRLLDVALELGEFDDRVEAVADLGGAEPGEDAACNYVLAAAQIAMEAAAEVEQPVDLPVADDTSRGRATEPAEKPQQSALARTVVTDQAERATGSNLERHVAKRPDLWGLVAAADLAHHRFLDRDRTRTCDAIALGDAFHLEHHRRPIAAC